MQYRTVGNGQVCGKATAINVSRESVRALLPPIEDEPRDIQELRIVRARKKALAPPSQRQVEPEGTVVRLGTPTPPTMWLIFASKLVSVVTLTRA